MKQVLRLLALAVVVSLSALFFLTGPADAESVLRAKMQADLKVIDPIWTTSNLTRDHGYMIYDTLFAVDAKGIPQPQMIEKYTVSSDNLVYTFTLREGLEWHDGKPVTAADCVASLKRWGGRDNFGLLLFAQVKAIEAKDPRSFVITLKEAFGPIIEALAEPSGNVPFMMPERVASLPSSQQLEDPTGSGPFIMKEWIPGSKVVYVRNPRYRPRPEPPSGLAGGKVVKLDKVEWVYIPDDGTVKAALLAGEIDLWLQPRLEFLPEFERNPQITVDVIETSPSQGILRMNHLLPPFNNVKARQALLWMINQEEYLKFIIGDARYYRTCYAMFMCNTPLATEVGTEALKGHSLERAGQLLKEAGYKGEPIVILQQTDAPKHNLAVLVTANNLRKMGVNVEIRPVADAMFFELRTIKKPVAEGGWNLFHTDFQGLDLSSPLTNAPLASRCTGDNWPGWPCDERIEALKTKYASEPDPAKRRQIAVDIQVEAMRYVTHGWIGEYQAPSAYRKSVKNLLRAPVIVFWNASKE